MSEPRSGTGWLWAGTIVGLLLMGFGMALASGYGIGPFVATGIVSLGWAIWCLCRDGHRAARIGSSMRPEADR